VNVGDSDELAAVHAALPDADQRRLGLLRDLLARLPRTSSAAIIPPTELISELFTHAGAQSVLLAPRVRCHASVG
jgi:hypothetical protein